MRVFIELAYDGTRYHGWQRQPQSITVQAVLEDTMARLFGGPCPVMGCGRTDAGVHASYFVAHAELPDGALGGRVADWEEAAMKLNGMLPHDIGIFAIHDVGPKAHARFDATERGYCYLIHTQKDPFLEGRSTRVHGSLEPGGHESRGRAFGSERRFRVVLQSRVGPRHDHLRRAGSPVGSAGPRPAGVLHHGRPVPSEHGPGHRRHPD